MNRMTIGTIAVLVVSGGTFVDIQVVSAQEKTKHEAASKQEPPIDFERARRLLQKRNLGQSLTKDEEAYLKRTLEARRAQENQNGAGRNLPPPMPRESTGLKPLSEMSAEDRYQGQDGGLYGEGRNSPPDDHLRAAEQELARIEPLDVQGKPSANGRIVFVSISMSNATQEFSKFKRIADSDKDKSAKLTIVDCAQGGQAMAEWVPLNARPWSVAEERIAAANVTPEQVQIAWVKLANIAPRGDLQDHGKKLQQDTARVLQNAKLRFPNLRIAYLSSRIYGGYATTNLNPEPYAYESAYPVRWLIQSQMKGDFGLDYHDEQRPAKVPLLLWGPYLWADGTTPRVDDQLTYRQEDLAADGTHPSEAGREKVAKVMLKFFKTDPLAKPWFAR